MENPAVFTTFERLSLPTPIAVLGRGRISEQLLNWFDNQSKATFTLFHLPDYDPVGLNEFGRLRARLANRVLLHIPDDLEQRFVRFGSRKLLNKPNTQAMLANLRASKCAEVLRVVKLIDKHNAGLEQESLLL